MLVYLSKKKVTVRSPPLRRAAVLEVELRVDVARDLLVGQDDLLEVDVDEVVERVDVLLDQPAHLEERRQELPLVLSAHQKVSHTRVVVRRTSTDGMALRRSSSSTLSIAAASVTVHVGEVFFLFFWMPRARRRSAIVLTVNSRCQIKG